MSSLLCMCSVLLWQDPGVDKVGRTNLDGSPMVSVSVNVSGFTDQLCCLIFSECRPLLTLPVTL